MSTVDTNKVEMHISGDVKVKLWQNGHYGLHKHNFISSHSVTNDVKHYIKFCKILV